MASSRSKRGKKPDVPTVVRRAPADRKRLPPELEEFARSDDKRLPPPRRRPRLQDPRPTALIPGVANRDARLVFDHHLEQMREWLVSDDASAQLDEALAVLWLARLWRGRSLTSFAAASVEFLERRRQATRRARRRGAGSGARADLGRGGGRVGPRHGGPDRRFAARQDQAHIERARADLRARGGQRPGGLVGDGQAHELLGRRPTLARPGGLTWPGSRRRSPRTGVEPAAPRAPTAPRARRPRPTLSPAAPQSRERARRAEALAGSRARARW